MNDGIIWGTYNCIALRSIVKWNIWVCPYSNRWWCWGRRKEENEQRTQCTCSNERKVRVHYMRAWNLSDSFAAYSSVVTAAHQQGRHASVNLTCTLLIHLHQFSTQNGFYWNDTNTIRIWHRNDQNTIKIKWTTNVQMVFSRLFVSACLCLFNFEFHRDSRVQWEFRLRNYVFRKFSFYYARML